MGDELQEIQGEDVAQSISYALKRDRKALGCLEPRDDEGYMRAARRVVEQLKLCGVRFFRRPPRWASFHSSAMQKRDEDKGG